MAVIKGKDGTVSIGGVNVGRVANFSLTIEADTLETTYMGQGSKRYDGSLKGWTASLEVHATAETSLDGASILNAQDFLGKNENPHNMTAGSAIAIVLSDGNTSYSGSAIITSVATDVAVAEIVTVSLDVTGNGALTES